MPIEDTQPAFLGGLNTVSDPAILAPTQARQLGNGRLLTYGAVTRRGGTRVCLAAVVGTGATGNVGLYWPLKTQVCVIAGAAPKLYTATRPASFTTTWTMTMDAGNTFQGTSLAIFTDGTNEVVYGQSQAGGLYKWDGTTATAVVTGTPVKVNGITVYNQRLWGWNSAASANSVYYSDLNLGDTFSVGASAGGQIIITNYAGAPIQFCGAVGASLMIFHSRGISRLTGFGLSDLSVSPVAATPDVSICAVHAGAIYHNAGGVATPQGLYQVTEGSAQPVGTPEAPDPTIAAIAAAASPTTVMVSASSRTQEIWVWVPGTGVYAYHVLLGAWSGPFTGAIFAAAAPSVPFEIRDSAVAVRTVLPPDTNGQMWEVDSPDWFSDSLTAAGASGTAYAMTTQCHRMFGRTIPPEFGGSPQVAAKVWRRADVLATLTAGATAPTIATASVFGGTSTVTFAAPTATQQVYYNAAGGAGPYVDVTITDTGTAASTYASVTVTGDVVGIR